MRRRRETERVGIRGKEGLRGEAGGTRMVGIRGKGGLRRRREGQEG